MPFTCVVPGCQGNYRSGPKVHIFGFPKDADLANKWMRAIKRDNFTPTKNSKVCESHFRACDIRKEAFAFDEKTGRTVRASLKVPRLEEGAIPCLLPNCPSSGPAFSRESPDKSRIEQIALSNAPDESRKVVMGNLVKMDDSQSDVPVDEFIISEIREKYTYVYNFRDYRYRNRNLRNKAWREIGVSVGMEARDVSARWKSLRDKYVREKRTWKSGSGAAEKLGNRLHSLLGFLDDVLHARRATRNLTESIISSTDVKEEAEIDTEESNSRSSVPPSPLPSACSPLYLTSAPFPSPTTQCSNNINSSLPSSIPTSAPFCIPIEPTTPQTTLKPATPMNSRRRNSMKVNNGRRKEEDLAALIRNQLKEMDECDLYCLSLAARLKIMPRQDMDVVRFKIEQILMEFAHKEK